MPSAVDLILNDRLAGSWRQKVCGDLQGDVCEFGFGSGTNLRFYGPGVQRIWAVEPSSSARVRFEETRAKLGEAWPEVIWASKDAADVSRIADSSMDAVVTTWAMCSIPDIEGALREARRILKPQGVLSFVEHGLAPSGNVPAIQNWLQPVWGKFSGGCHLNRDTVALVEAAGFAPMTVHSEYVEGWFWPARPWSWFTFGRAVPA